MCHLKKEKKKPEKLQHFIIYLYVVVEVVEDVVIASGLNASVYSQMIKLLSNLQRILLKFRAKQTKLASNFICMGECTIISTININKYLSVIREQVNTSLSLCFVVLLPSVNSRPFTLFPCGCGNILFNYHRRLAWQFHMKTTYSLAIQIN